MFNGIQLCKIWYGIRYDGKMYDDVYDDDDLYDVYMCADIVPSHLSPLKYIRQIKTQYIDSENLVYFFGKTRNMYYVLSMFCWY